MMFPGIRISVAGLEPNANYVMAVEFGPVGGNSYRFAESEWDVFLGVY